MADDVEGSAADSYRTHAREIRALLRVLRERLAEHAKLARRSPEDWRHAGDLLKVREGLVELASFLGQGSSEATVRAELERRIREILGR